MKKSLFIISVIAVFVICYIAINNYDTTNYTTLNPSTNIQKQATNVEGDSPVIHKTIAQIGNVLSTELS